MFKEPAQVSPRRVFFRAKPSQRSMFSRWVLVLGLLGAQFAQATDTAGSSDPRLTSKAAPHPWQTAIVKIAVPGSRFEQGRRIHVVEDCTGTLVSIPAVRVVSAWHCFADADNLAKPPKLLIDGHWHPLRLLASGGSMEADWAILAPTSAYAADVGDAYTPTSQQRWPTIRKSAQPVPPGSPLIMAGFSGDEGIGDSGESLSFDPDCRLIDYDAHWGRTNCQAFKGASGGPVLITQNGEKQLIGVISASDDSGRRLFTPITRFRQALRRYGK